jgi:type II secretory pathway pseudopilin PulG
MEKHVTKVKELLSKNVSNVKMIKKIKRDKKAQIWIETAIYTLIGLAIIGIVLAIAYPAINRYKDEVIIDQTITLLNKINEKIIEVRDMGTGNKRIINLQIEKGQLIINSEEDKIEYLLEESGLKYSEPGQEIEQGDIRITTEEVGTKYTINLVLPYQELNITYKSNEEEKTLTPAPSPYEISIENKGSSNGKVQINIE